MLDRRIRRAPKRWAGGLTARAGIHARGLTKLWALALLALSLALVGCGPYVFISSYDEQTDVGVTTLEKKVEGLLDQLAVDPGTPVPTYDSLKATYADIHADLTSLDSRNRLREKNTITVKQIVELMAEFNTLEATHQKGKIIPLMVAKPTAAELDGGPMRQSLRQTFRAILKLELTKKETAGSE